MPTQTKQQKTRRAPVIVVLGHVDHGKSTLLDYIRKENTTDKEAGGITQHVSAYEAQITDKSGVTHALTFLDTPGHEAFCTIRERGARAADLAVLVVSGEDGVKPQTLEALSCIKESNIPFIIAINKIDKPSANLEQTKANLAENEIYIEGYGGDIPFVACSATTGQGVSELLEMLSLMAELQDLTCDLSKPAEGIVIEAHLDQKRGTTASLVIKDGTLTQGHYVVSGVAFSPIRSIENYKGDLIEQARAGSPVRLVGWNQVPVVGELFREVANKKEAEKAASDYQPTAPHIKKPIQQAESEDEKRVVIPLIIRTDTVGSLDAIQHEIKKITVENVIFRILHAGVGTITESDVKTARVGKEPVIIGFNVRTDAQAKAGSERLEITIKNFDIIYRLSEWLQEEAERRRPRIEVEEEMGNAKILKVFNSEKGKFVIGGRVDAGLLKTGASLKLLRRDEEVGRGKIKGLQQQKLKADEISKGKEFGAMLELSIEPAEGDRISVYTTTIK